MAMLFGSMLSPTLAHAAGPDVAHLFESTHVEFEHLVAAGHHRSESSSGQSSSGESPGNALPHHHCAANLALIVPEADLGVMSVRVSMFRPHRATVLASWQSALPIEPPAA